MPSDSAINTQHDFNAIKKGLQTFSHINEIESILKQRFKDFCFHTLKDIPHPKELHNNMEASSFCMSKYIA